MRKTVLPILLPALLSGLLAVSSTAIAGPMQAGLWEITVKSDAMKGMPQISQAQMEQMKRMGISIPQMNNGGIVSRVCVTPEMAAREQPPMQQQKDCQVRNMRQRGNMYTADIICNSAELQGKGTVRANYSGGTSFQSTYSFKGMSHGQPVNQSHESTGTWLGSDCGSVQPISN